MNRRKIRTVLKQYLLIVLLILLVLVSLGLSFGIWHSMGDQSVYMQATDTSETDKRLVSEKGIEAVYDFDYVVLNHNKKHQRVINSRRTSRDVLTVMGDWQLEDAVAEKLDKKTYLALQNEDNTVLLGYPDQVIGGLVESRLNVSVGLTDDDRIDRVQLPMNGEGEVRFFNDRTHDVYRAKVTGGGTKLTTIKWPTDTADVTLRLQKDRVDLEYLESIQLKTKSYLLDEADKSSAIATAFKSTGVTPRIVESDGDRVEYTDGDSRRLLLDVSSGDVNLTEYDNQSVPKVMSSNLKHAYDTLVALKQVPENMYYFEEKDDGMALTYRLYVNGLPMFVSENFGFGKVSVNYEQHRQTIDYSLYSLQVPLPDKDEQIITLKNTKSVMASLAAAGIDTENVQDMRIGYNWLENDQAQYITLQPGWFIRINNEWAPLSSYTKAV